MSPSDVQAGLALLKEIGAIRMVKAVSSLPDTKGETVVCTTLENKAGGNATYGIFEDDGDEDEQAMLELMVLLLNNAKDLLAVAQVAFEANIMVPDARGSQITKTQTGETVIVYRNYADYVEGNPESQIPVFVPHGYNREHYIEAFQKGMEAAK